MTYRTRILFGALLEWLRKAEFNINKRIGPWLCPRKYTGR